MAWFWPNVKFLLHKFYSKLSFQPLEPSKMMIWTILLIQNSPNFDFSLSKLAEIGIFLTNLATFRATWRFWRSPNLVTMLMPWLEKAPSLGFKAEKPASARKNQNNIFHVVAPASLETCSQFSSERLSVLKWIFWRKQKRERNFVFSWKLWRNITLIQRFEKP